jgi:hypothetical protein
VPFQIAFVGACHSHSIACQKTLDWTESIQQTLQEKTKLRWPPALLFIGPVTLEQGSQRLGSCLARLGLEGADGTLHLPASDVRADHEPRAFKAHQDPGDEEPWCQWTDALTRHCALLERPGSAVIDIKPHIIFAQQYGLSAWMGACIHRGMRPILPTVCSPDTGRAILMPVPMEVTVWRCIASQAS